MKSYNEFLLRVFNAIGYEEDQYSDLMVLFYLGLCGEFVDVDDGKLEEKVKALVAEKLSESELLIKIRELVGGEDVVESIEKSFESYLKKYIDAVYDELDQRGKEICDSVREELAN